MTPLLKKVEKKEHKAIIKVDLSKVTLLQTVNCAKFYAFITKTKQDQQEQHSTIWSCP